MANQNPGVDDQEEENIRRRSTTKGFSELGAKQKRRVTDEVRSQIREISSSRDTEPKKVIGSILAMETYQVGNTLSKLCIAASMF